MQVKLDSPDGMVSFIPLPKTRPPLFFFSSPELRSSSEDLKIKERGGVCLYLYWQRLAAREGMVSSMAEKRGEGVLGL